MKDINQWLVAGKVSGVDMKDNGNVAKATLYVATDDTPPQYQGQEAPQPKWTKHRIIFFGDDAYRVSNLKRGAPIVVSGVFNYYKGTANNGQEFESFQAVGRRFWTPGEETKAAAKAQAAPPKEDPPPPPPNDPFVQDEEDLPF